MENEIEQIVARFWEEYEKGEIEIAEETSTEILSKFPDMGVAYYCKGHLFLLKKDYNNAFSCFDTALKGIGSDRFKSFVTFWMGQIYGTWDFSDNNPLYDSKKAEKCYLDVLNFEDYPIDVIFQLRNYFYDNPEFGIKKIEDSINKFPNEINLYILLAKLFYSKYNNKQKYLSILLSVNETQNKNIDVLILIAEYYYLERDFEKSKAYYDESLTLIEEDNNIEGYVKFQIGCIHLSMNKLEVAENYFLKAKELLPKDDLVSITLGLFLTKCEKYEVAEEIFETLDIEYWEFISLSQPHYLSYQYVFVETKIPFNYEDCIIILEKINADKNKRLAGKVALLKAIFWENIGNYENQIIELQLVANVFNYQYLVENTFSAFSNWLSLIQEDKVAVTKFISLLHSFIARKNFKDYFIENYLDEFIEFIFEKGLYDSLYSLISFFSDAEIQNDSATCFNCAYCFNHVGNKEKAKDFYTHYIENYGDSSAVLNNLALIYESEGDTINAKVMFEKAVAIEPNNKKVISNLERITNHENEKIKEREENEKIQIQYKEASQRISFENDYVLEKLSNFIKNSYESPDFKNGKIALPEWRIPPFMQATKEKALSLKEQFISKKYIIKTKQKNEFNSYYYEINPYIESEIKKVLAERNRTVDKKWIEGFENITAERLEKIQYFELLEKISKFNKKFKPFIERDFKELCLNYLMGNAKSTVVLSGSLVELLLIYLCERKKITTVTYNNPRSMKSVTEKLYDCDLFGLIIYTDENKLLGKDFPYLGHLMRVYRNLIHPGCELRQDQGIIDESKVEISFKGTIEILKRIL